MIDFFNFWKNLFFKKRKFKVSNFWFFKIPNYSFGCIVENTISISRTKKSIDELLSVSFKKNIWSKILKFFFTKHLFFELLSLPIGKIKFFSGVFFPAKTRTSKSTCEVIFDYESNHKKISFKNFSLFDAKIMKKGDIISLTISNFKNNFTDYFIFRRFFNTKTSYIANKAIFLPNLALFTKKEIGAQFKNGHLIDFFVFFKFVKEFFEWKFLWSCAILRHNFGPEYRFHIRWFKQ